MRKITERISERHAIAFILVCYGITLLDPRATTGTVGFMLSNYSHYFVWLMAAWCLFGASWLILRRAYPVTMAMASLPILAYAVMGAVFVLRVSNAPIAAFFIHFGAYGLVLFLITLRIRAMAKGVHADDTLPTRPNP